MARRKRSRDGGSTRAVRAASERLSTGHRSPDAAHESDVRLRCVTRATRDAIYDWDVASGRVWRNEAYQELYAPDEPVGTDATWWERHLHPEDRERVKRSVRDAFRQRRETWSDEYRFRRHDGRYADVMDRGCIVYGPGGESLRFIGAITDVTERKREEALRAGQSRILEMIPTDASLPEVLEALAGLLESQSEGMLASILLLDEDGQHVRHGAAPSLPEDYVRAIDGAPIGPRAGSCGTAMYRREQVVVTDVLTDPLWEDYRELAALHGLLACWSTPFFSRHGSVLGSFAMYYRKVRSPTDDETTLIALATHIAAIAVEHKQAEERVIYLAHHDALTDLPNRLLFYDRIGQAIAQARREREQVAVLLLDLDHFKDINDSLGHPIGDRLLRALAGRLQGCVRKGDSVARLGGDEFVVGLPALRDSDQIPPVAEKLLAAARRPFSVDGHTLHVSGSMGIAVYPNDGDVVDLLVSNADAALYDAKESGRNSFRFFRPELNDAIQRRMLIAKRLRGALRRQEFVVHYQPQIDLISGRVLAAEALLRWRQPGGSLVSGASFIDVAEKSGVIVPLGEWVLHEACGQLRRWHEAGHGSLRIAVNVSPLQIRNSGFYDLLVGILERTGLSPGALELEITEGILMLQSPENVAAVERVVEMGVHLAVDDFGTGYSSLTLLQRFPVHTLKIDRSFVSALCHDPSSREIVTTIIAMARSLNLQVVAEGVETADQAAFLTESGCPLAQGFFYSKVVSADDFSRLLGGEDGPAARTASG